MRVVHFSDWHQQRLNLPEADLYICTGDMLPDDDFDDWPVPAESSEMFQSDWVNTFAGTYRNKLFACKDAPLVYVRGNHDFTDFGALFDGGENHQITLDPTIVHQVLGMRIGGFRGVPWMNRNETTVMGSTSQGFLITRPRRVNANPRKITSSVTPASPHRR